MSDTQPDPDLDEPAVVDVKLYRDGAYVDGQSGGGVVAVLDTGDVAHLELDQDGLVAAWLRLATHIADREPLGYRQAWLRGVVANAHIPGQQARVASSLGVPTAQTVLDAVGEVLGEDARDVVAIAVRKRLG